MSSDTRVLIRKIVSQNRSEVRRNGGVLRHSPVARHEMVSQDTSPVLRYEAGGLRHLCLKTPFVLHCAITVRKNLTARVAVSPHYAVEYFTHEHFTYEHRSQSICMYVHNETNYDTD